MKMGKTIHAGGRPLWAEISLKAMAKNLAVIRRHIGPKPKILAVVKANAYGLGAVPVSKALAKAGADRFGVTCQNEGIELREAGIRKPILVLTGFWHGEEKSFIRHGLTPTVTRLEDVRNLERAAKAAHVKSPLRFHLKINTGMNRLGLPAEQIDAFASALADCRHIELEGTFTHFASAEDFSAQETDEQEAAFHRCLDRLRALRVSPGIVHMANSGAICARPSTWADMVRPGAILYGYYQSFDPPQKGHEVQRRLPVEPSLSLRARIISLRDLPAGQPVGYSAKFVTARPSRIAVINAGYADGILRQRTNHGCVLLRGRGVPMVGTISMDLTALDVTDVPDAALGDIVTIYGRDGEAEIRVSDVAREIGTVTSDLLCALGRRVPRYYL
jgi:alanine racemase